jgi:hypothetical protein
VTPARAQNSLLAFAGKQGLLLSLMGKIEWNRRRRRGEGEEMTITSRYRHGRRSWKDSPRAKTIAATISLLLGVGLIIVLVFAFLSMRAGALS